MDHPLDCGQSCPGEVARRMETDGLYMTLWPRLLGGPVTSCDGDSDTPRPCWTLSLRFVRAFPLFFGLPIYGLFLAVYFGYVVSGRYVMSMWLLWYAV